MADKQQNDDYAVFIEWLEERGHTRDEIEKIMAEVERYEQETQLDSVMDSIGNGTLSLDTLIKDALGK